MSFWLPCTLEESIPMRKKGLKGRKPIGPERKYSCSDREYARIKIAAKLAKSKTATIAREATIEKADEIIKAHLNALRSLELTDDLMKEIAAEYLAGQQGLEPDEKPQKKSAKKQG